MDIVRIFFIVALVIAAVYLFSLALAATTGLIKVLLIVGALIAVLAVLLNYSGFRRG